MKAMILAAGRGERLRPLTDKTPKPLIKVAGKSLIEYHLQSLSASGFNEIIINTAWLAEKIHHEVGDGSDYGVSIRYSDEGKALETAGGIIRALPLLGDKPFLVVNGDIWCDYDFSKLPEPGGNQLAHLILVNNPEHNQSGDFALHNGLVKTSGDAMYTYSGIGIFSPAFFTDQPSGPLPLGPIIREQCQNDLVSGELYEGLWTDAGTVERLQQLEKQIQNITGQDR
jgi:MurNAc alpha-1-phosphate uridylyltransferase